MTEDPVARTKTQAKRATSGFANVVLLKTHTHLLSWGFPDFTNAAALESLAGGFEAAELLPKLARAGAANGSLGFLSNCLSLATYHCTCHLENTAGYVYII